MGIDHKATSPYAIASHITDPKLTTNEKIALTTLEVAIAVGGIALAAATPVGWIGALIGVGYGIGTYIADTYVTNELDKKQWSF
ncbi:MAG: hypothetical protein ABF904_12785 [Ethanoligenens sp.]